MQSISINLLPPELQTLKEQEIKRARFNKLSLGILGVTMLFVGLSIFLKVTQVFDTTSLNSEVASLKSQLTQFKTQEGLAFLIKDRLTTIQQKKSEESVPVVSFNLTEKLIPSGVKISSFNVDDSQTISISGATTSLASLQQFFDNLVDQNLTEGRIKNVEVESLSQNTSGISFDLILHQN